MNKTVVFAYHDIGCIGIEALLAANYTIQAVFTHMDDPKENRFFDSVAQLCVKRGIMFHTPENINRLSWIEYIRQLHPRFLYSFYYRNLLSEDLLGVAPDGAFNLHGSLLPRYRGRAPVNWALVNGEKETGVTLHRMVKRADAGAILAQEKVLITNDDTALTLHEKICEASRTLLNEILPKLIHGDIIETAQDERLATKFGRRTPSDGEIHWYQSAQQIHNLIRAVTVPYPGAFTFIDERKIIIWNARVIQRATDRESGTVCCLDPFQIVCGYDTLEVIAAQQGDNGLFQSGAQLAREMELHVGMRVHSLKSATAQRRTSILIIGVNSLLGAQLVERLLSNKFYEIYGLDTNVQKIDKWRKDDRFHFVEADIKIQSQLLEFYVHKCDIVLPLTTLNTPRSSPLQLYERTFDDNMKIVRVCVQYNKRLVFPSSATVYGPCEDPYLDENSSNLIIGATHQKGWMHAASSQLLERVIAAYGQKGLQFTIYRPFNWIEVRHECFDPPFVDCSTIINNILRRLISGQPIKINKNDSRTLNMMDSADGVEALVSIIESQNGCCDRQIINIGNSDNNITYRELAEEIQRQYEIHPLRKLFPSSSGFIQTTDDDYWESDYPDVSHCKPNTKLAKQLLNWSPRVSLLDTIRMTLEEYLHGAFEHLDKITN